VLFRQYLDNEGLGYGTPAQRQKQYQKFKAVRAAENVFRHRVDRINAQYETQLAHRLVGFAFELYVAASTGTRSGARSI